MKRRVLLLFLSFALSGAACAPPDDDESSEAAVDGPICGDANCDANESCVVCAIDCGACTGAFCGDSVCEASESCSTCEADCGACEASCGDGACNGEEDCGSCEADCGACEWPPEWIALEERMLELVNEFRESGGECPSGPMPATHPLAWNEELTWAARLHAVDMGEQGYFSHDSLDGRSPWDRMHDAGYEGSPRAENIAGGSGTAEATFQQWKSSDGHCRNMMSSQVNELGVGYAFVEGSPFGHYWVQNFGWR